MGPALVAALPAAISGAGSILGGIFGSNSAAEQNREERAWQEYMANTQYQRGVSDMKAAGLNPLMLYGKGGMSAGVGGGARMDESVGIREGVRGAVPAMLQGLSVLEMKARINDINSAASMKEAQTAAINQAKEIEKLDWEGRLGDPAGFDNVNEWGQQWGRLQRQKAGQEIAESLARVENLSWQNARIDSENAMRALEKMMLEKKIPFATAWETYWKQVGVTGAYFEVGGKLFQQVAGTLGIANIGRKLLNPGQVSGGASSAKQAERMENVFEYNNNQSDMIGR